MNRQQQQLTTKRAADEVWVLAWMFLMSVVFAGAGFAQDESDFELPPPPVSAPQVDLMALDMVPYDVEGEGILLPVEDSQRAMRRTLTEFADSLQKENKNSDASSLEDILAAVGQEAPRRLTLESMLFSQLRDQLPAGGEGYLIDQVSIPAGLELPEEGWQAEFEFRFPRGKVGHISYTSVLSDRTGRSFHRFSGSVRVDRQVEALQLKHRVKRGEPVGPADVDQVQTRLSQLPAGAVCSLEKLQGVVAKNELRTGLWLTSNMIKVPEMIHRGDVVILRLDHGAINITAKGIARQGGAMGEVIVVENVSSRRQLMGRVMSDKEVQVVY